MRYYISFLTISKGKKYKYRIDITNNLYNISKNVDNNTFKYLIEFNIDNENVDVEIIKKLLKKLLKKVNYKNGHDKINNLYYYTITSGRRLYNNFKNIINEQISFKNKYGVKFIDNPREIDDIINPSYTNKSFIAFLDESSSTSGCSSSENSNEIISIDNNKYIDENIDNDMNDSNFIKMIMNCVEKHDNDINLDQSDKINVIIYKSKTYLLTISLNKDTQQNNYNIGVTPINNMNNNNAKQVEYKISRHKNVIKSYDNKNTYRVKYITNLTNKITNSYVFNDDITKVDIDLFEYKNYLINISFLSPFQNKACNQILAYYCKNYKVDIYDIDDDHDKCIVNWICRMGKTRLALGVIYNSLLYKILNFKSIVIYVPSNILITQWHAEIDKYLDILNYDVIQFNPKSSANIIKKCIEDERRFIIICFYGNSNKLNNIVNSIDQDYTFDFKIYDEVHHVAKRNIDKEIKKDIENINSSVVESDNDTELSDSVNNDNEKKHKKTKPNLYCWVIKTKAKYQLSLSATLSYTDKHTHKEKYYISNNEKKIFGPVISTKAFRDGLKYGRLVDFNIRILPCYKNDINNMSNYYNNQINKIPSKYDGEYIKKMSIIYNVLSIIKLLHEGYIKHNIFFTNTIDRIKECENFIKIYFKFNIEEHINALYEDMVNNENNNKNNLNKEILRLTDTKIFETSDTTSSLESISENSSTSLSLDSVSSSEYFSETSSNQSRYLLENKIPNNINVLIYTDIKAYCKNFIDKLPISDITIKKRQEDELLTKIVTDNNNVIVFATHSKSNIKNSDMFKYFKLSKKALLFAVYMVGEGIDIPYLDSVNVGENMYKEIRITQSILRAVTSYNYSDLEYKPLMKLKTTDSLNNDDESEQIDNEIYQSEKASESSCCDNISTYACDENTQINNNIDDENNLESYINETNNYDKDTNYCNILNDIKSNWFGELSDSNNEQNNNVYKKECGLILLPLVINSTIEDLYQKNQHNLNKIENLIEYLKTSNKSMKCIMNIIYQLKLLNKNIISKINVKSDDSVILPIVIKVIDELMKQNSIDIQTNNNEYDKFILEIKLMSEKYKMTITGPKSYKKFRKINKYLPRDPASIFVAFNWSDLNLNIGYTINEVNEIILKHAEHKSYREYNSNKQNNSNGVLCPISYRLYLPLSKESIIENWYEIKTLLPKMSKDVTEDVFYKWYSKDK